MKLLLIENIRGSFVATPVLNGKRDDFMTCEFWTEAELTLFVSEFFLNPYAAIYAFEAIKQHSGLAEIAGVTH